MRYLCRLPLSACCDVNAIVEEWASPDTCTCAVVDASVPSSHVGVRTPQSTVDADNADGGISSSIVTALAGSVNRRDLAGNAAGSRNRLEQIPWDNVHPTVLAPITKVCHHQHDVHDVHVAVAIAVVAVVPARGGWGLSPVASDVSQVQHIDHAAAIEVRAGAKGRGWAAARRRRRGCGSTGPASLRRGRWSCPRSSHWAGRPGSGTTPGWLRGCRWCSTGPSRCRRRPAAGSWG